jgi:dUTP pyrophosphatase
MDKKQAEDYIKKLEELEKNLSGLESDEDDDGLDINFMSELGELLSKLETDVKVERKTPTEPKYEPNNLIVKVKKLSPNAVVPSYSKFGDAGMDLTITSEISNTTFDVSYGFGIAMEIPDGYVGLVFPRSSVRNQDLLLTNCVGVIDSGYRGEIQATFKKTNGLDSLKYNVGDRGAQIIILPYPQVTMVESNELSDTERGAGGFGSTGV